MHIENFSEGCESDKEAFQTVALGILFDTHKAFLCFRFDANVSKSGSFT